MVLRHHALPARLEEWRVLDQVSGVNDVTPAVDSEHAQDALVDGGYSSAHRVGFLFAGLSSQVAPLAPSWPAVEEAFQTTI